MDRDFRSLSSFRALLAGRVYLFFLCSTVAFFSFPSVSSGEEELLKPGDRIVFFGDSITAQGVGPYGYVTLFARGLSGRQEKPGVSVQGAGESGNRVIDLQGRLDRDVLSKNPTVVVIYVGVNDVFGLSKKRSKNVFEKKKTIVHPRLFETALLGLVNRLKEAKVRIVLCTPSVIGERTQGKNPLDAQLDHYADIVRQIAEREKVQLVDIRKRFVSYLTRHNDSSLPKGILTTDGVHLNSRGNRLLADIFLDAFCVAGKSH